MDLLSAGTRQFQPMELWTLDYCPKTLDEIIGNEEVKFILSQYLAKGHIPDLLLTGSHGTCKRTFARLLARTYLGEHYEKGCLSIDGAVCRSKDVIAPNQQKKAASDKPVYSGSSVLEYARSKISLGGKSKLIIIYNFEDMIIDAQNALRRIMEQYAATTRFILICNRLNNIIEAIQSRCIPLQTKLLSPEDARILVSTIMQHRGLPPLGNDIMHIIGLLADGDIKKIVNYLQTISVISHVTIEKFHEIFNVPPVKLLTQMLVDTVDPSTQGKVLERVTLLLNQGYNYTDILEILSKITAYTDCVPAGYRMLFLEEISRAYCEMSLYTANVHLYALFCRFARIAVPDSAL